MAENQGIIILTGFVLQPKDKAIFKVAVTNTDSRNNLNIENLTGYVNAKGRKRAQKVDCTVTTVLPSTTLPLGDLAVKIPAIIGDFQDDYPKCWKR